MTTELYIGLMSGTSIDGIDAALVNFENDKLQLVAHHYAPYSNELRQNILSLCETGHNEIDRFATLDVVLGKMFAREAMALIDKATLTAKDIRAIGSHGQTIRHKPNSGFTLQIGDPNIISAETNITTIADFRRKDIAKGGQGAPLVPAFHQYALSTYQYNQAVVNIGGIANVTLLHKRKQPLGFDTGPGNTLLDAWIARHQGLRHDESGSWAATGNIQQELLRDLLDDDYFKLTPPKSTGREYFNLKWLDKVLQQHPNCSPIDVQATLVELTAHSILNTIDDSISEILICGGGAHNHYLMSRLQTLANPVSIKTTETYGLPPDWIEAMAFAWLARQTLSKLPGNIPVVTGAREAAILGGIYYAS